MSCDECLNRRDFLARGGLAVAGAAVLAGCGDGQFGPTAVVPSVAGATVSVKVSTLPGLATVGQPVQVSIPQQVIAKRTGPNTFAAFSSICTHQGCSVNIVGNALDCPCHGSQFDSDGHVTRQPVGGGSSTNLPAYSTRYDASTDILTIS